MSEILEMYHSMSGCGLSDLQTVLKVINEHQALDSKQREKLTPLVSDITESLQRAGTRSRGLLTLQCLLQSSLAGDEILADKGSAWMCFCVAALKAPRDQALAYNVIKLLLEKCSSVHELDRTVINASLPELTLSLAKCSPQSYIHALKCLETLLSRYSKASGGHKSAIEKFLLKFLDSRNKRDVMYAAKCAHLLQQVRGGGEQGINHKMAWRLQLDLLTEASSNILSSLYSQTIDSYGIGSIDYFNADTDQNKQNMKPEHSSSNVGPLTAALRDIEEEDAAEDAAAELGNPIIRKAIRRAVRLENLLVFIQAMLVDPFPVNKRISCRPVLSLLIRCQSAASGRPSPAGMEPSLHCAVSDTLRALTFCLKGNILPYSSLIMRMALQTLEWSRTKNQVLGIKPFKNVRKSAYAMLSTILRCVHTIRLPTQQGDQSFEDKIFENMFEDIVPHRVTIQLTVKSSSGGPVKNMSQKARRKMTMAQLEGSSIAGHSPHGPNSKGEDSELANSDLTISALDCMDSLFVASGNFFKATTYQLVQENLIRMLYEVNQRSLAVKRGLTHTLMVVQQYSSTTCPSPIAHCLNLFSLGQHCGSLKLSAFAHSALNASLSSIRGAAPPLLIPKPVEQSTSTAEEKRKSVEQTKLMELLAAEEKNRKGLTNGDVIEVGESIDSASQGEDSQASEGETGAGNSKKRKRSGDRRLQNLVNSSNVISSPAGKRTKISESDNTAFTVETQEISDNESEAADTTIVIDGNPSDDEVIFMDDEVTKVNGNDNSKDCDVSSSNDVMVNENRVYMHKLKKHNSVTPDKGANKELDNSNSGNDTIEENVCTNVDFLKNSREIDKSVIHESLHTDLGEKKLEDVEDVSKVEGVEGSKMKGEEVKIDEVEKKGTHNVSIEEMLGSFVDEVNEDLK